MTGITFTEVIISETSDSDLTTAFHSVVSILVWVSVPLLCPQIICCFMLIFSYLIVWERISEWYYIQ